MGFAVSDCEFILSWACGLDCGIVPPVFVSFNQRPQVLSLA